MAQIGSFTPGENGIYTGEIRTLTLRVKATIRPCERDNDKSPDHRVSANGVEFGAAWTPRRARPARNISASSSTIPRSPRRSTRRSARAITASISSSGRAERSGPALRRGATLSGVSKMACPIPTLPVRCRARHPQGRGRQNMMAAQYRAETIERAREAQAQIDAQAATTKFLGSGTAYTPQ